MGTITKQDIVLDGATAMLRGMQFRLWPHRTIQGPIKSGNFSQDARGRWYRNLVCEVRCSRGRGHDDIGVDLGLESVATCSDGTALEQARFYHDLEPKLAEAQRKKREPMPRGGRCKVARPGSAYHLGKKATHSG